MLIPTSFASSVIQSAVVKNGRYPAAAVSSLYSSPLDGLGVGIADGYWKSVVLTTLIRGGELFARQHTEHIDINRVRMRLEGLQAYGTLCALLANGCLRLYSSVSVPSTQRHDSNSNSEEQEKTDSHTQRKMLRKRLALDGFFLCVVLSVLSGSYTTVVFTLLPLYSKIALGRGYDQQFLQFWAATTSIRETGFNAFLLSLVSFEVAFVLSLYIRLRGQRKRTMVFVAAIICMLSFWDWTRVMQMASKFLFTLHAEVHY